MANNQYDCEPYLRALEEQADSIGAATTDMLQCLNTFKNSAESVVRSVDNLKRMIAMTRRAMVLAHGDRVVERVEIKRETVTPPSQTAAEKEDWGDQPSTSQSSQQREDWDAELTEEQTVAVPSYRTVKLAVPSYRTVKFQRWAVRCPACGARPGHCPCS